ncbi:MAG TPA: hypothetical protein VF486_10305 [Actinomycetes bacterium]
MSLFEPDPPDPPVALASPLAGGRPLGAAEGSRRTRWGWLLVSSAATLVVGVVLGFALGSERSGGTPAGTTLARPPATRPAPAPVTSATVRSVASPACLETAARGDEIIDLLVRGRRGRAADLLGAYTTASRQCRRDADP